GIIGYLIAVVVQTMIRKLRNIEYTTYSKEQLILFDAVVINAILPGKYGRISIQTYEGITTSYPAKAEDSTVRINQDTKVRVVRFDRNVAIVQEDIEKKYS
ncbi:MAG TPA: hypothetical protein VHQ24_05690, partial [Lachnospiraceae bacterium]|nr:hypothetical protein [Lachnospiraceae bacterium]